MSLIKKKNKPVKLKIKFVFLYYIKTESSLMKNLQDRKIN